jgi:hypothetical protein
MTGSDSGRSDAGVLKRDAMGRVRTSVRQREALLDEFERSGLSGPKFAQIAGVCYQTFAGWMQRRRRVRGDYDSSAGVALSAQRDGGAPMIRWVEAAVETDAGSGGGSDGSMTKEQPPAAHPVRVVLAGGVSVELSHAGQVPLVAELLRELNIHCARSC